MKKLLVTACCGLLVACAGHVDVGTETEPLKADLNVVVAEGAVTPVDGMTASGQPDEAALRVFADSGYTAVIDLRMPGEDRGIDEEAVVEGLGMNYVSLPVGRDDITYEKAAELDELLAGASGPVLLHCGSSNRVGALLALRASAAGADDEAAIEIGKDGGLTSLEPKVREALSGRQ